MSPQELPMAPPPAEAPVAITDQALEKVLEFRAGVPDAEKQAMWLEVTGMSGGEWTYNMSLKPVDLARPGDSVQQNGGLAIVVPAADLPRVRGATIDWSEDMMQGGLLLLNPNTPSPTMAGAPILETPRSAFWPTHGPLTGRQQSADGSSAFYFTDGHGSSFRAVPSPPSGVVRSFSRRYDQRLTWNVWIFVNCVSRSGLF